MTIQTIDHYLEQLASRAATPGGGAAAALSGAQAAALIAMVCRLTRGHDDEIATVTKAAESARQNFLDLMRADIDSFNEVMAAFRLKGAQRDAALPRALASAANVPMAMIVQALELTPHLQRLLEIGNKNLITDVGIAATLASATILAAKMNVLINCRSMSDDQAATLRQELNGLITKAEAIDAVVARTFEQLDA